MCISHMMRVIGESYVVCSIVERLEHLVLSVC